jgi:hypothetical protein
MTMFESEWEAVLVALIAAREAMKAARRQRGARRNARRLMVCSVISVTVAMFASSGPRLG